MEVEGGSDIIKQSNTNVSIVLFVIFLLAFPSTVFADVAPPANPPGSNPWPGSDTTQVRMQAETVLVDVKNNSNAARVTADFTMHNLGEQPESMAVRFPIASDNGFGKFPEIKDMAIKVNGKPVTFRRINYRDIRNYNDHEVPWAEFDVTFPAGQDVPIQVSYNLDGSGYAPYFAFNYVLETGAGWKDTIGSADITLRLPYEASPQNVILAQIGWGETTPGGVFQGRDVRWHFSDFEPGPDGPVQNMQFTIVAPATWLNVLKAGDNAASHPNDSEAWGQLGKSYKEVYVLPRGYRDDDGGKQLYQSSLEAYQKCLALNPKDAQWHAGYANLLAGHAYFDSFMGNPPAETYQALDEIRTALTLAPQDDVVLQNADTISMMFPDGMKKSGSGYTFLWLSQTPTPLPTSTPVAPAFDPANVSGTYQTDLITLRSRKKAHLILTLGADYSAQLVVKYQSEPPALSMGTWADNGDSTITIKVTDSNQKSTEIIYNFKGDLLVGNTIPAFFGDMTINASRMGTATPVPGPTKASNPARTQPATNAAASTAPVEKTPVSTPPLPMCGSAALVVILVFWLRRLLP